MSPARPGEVQVRRAKSADLDGIMAVEEECFSAPWPRDSMREEILANPVSRVLVAAVDGVVVGFIDFWMVSDEIHLQNIATTAERRRSGVARSLMEALLAAARKKGSALVTLEVRVSNDPARRLYESYGFIPAGLRKKYYIDNGEDALIMYLDLGGVLAGSAR